VKNHKRAEPVIFEAIHKFMSFNIHPLLVHFPIAFLLLYSLLTILPIQHLIKGPWQEIRRILLICGVGGALASGLTGELAEGLFRVQHNLVEIHANMAKITIALYSALCLGEILLLTKNEWNKLFAKNASLSNICQRTMHALTHPTTVKIIATLGAITLCLTGLLGGMISHPSSTDPLAPLVKKIFVQ
jgi:uncharacterized membrane protein